MITGEVKQAANGGLEPWLTLSIEYANEGVAECEVMLDTGFTGWLALPEGFIRQLGLVRVGRPRVTLATGEIRQVDYYVGRVFWDGAFRQVGIFQTVDQSLLGMQLLKDNRITIEAWAGGSVIITGVQ